MIDLLNEVLDVTPDNLITIVTQHFDSWDFPTKVPMEVHSSDTGGDTREEWFCSFYLHPNMQNQMEIYGHCITPMGYKYENAFGVLTITPLNALSSRVRLATKAFPGMISRVFMPLGFHILKEIINENHAYTWLASTTQRITGISTSAIEKASNGQQDAAIGRDKIESAGRHIIHTGPNSTAIVLEGKPVNTPPLTSTEQDVQSLQQQLADARENLRLIEERKAQYVQEVEIPLQLIKDERRLKEQIAELEGKLSAQS